MTTEICLVPGSPSRQAAARTVLAGHGKMTVAIVSKHVGRFMIGANWGPLSDLLTPNLDLTPPVFFDCSIARECS